jgi:hypothetical protein
LPIVQSVVRAAHVASEHSSVARNTFDQGFRQLNALAEQAIQMKAIGDE